MNNSGLWVGAATVPLLAGVIAGRVLSRALLVVSIASEEVFRGDRLPVLHFEPAELVSENASPEAD
ncbi:MAG: hypothetical protein KME20_14065 [Kaiparowitsia implicata GSE-PSE-MK54-09C]|nr:hypothetical protein [Kaiparowitsia implicata GSE-PSE-MK54-09C]